MKDIIKKVKEDLENRRRKMDVEDSKIKERRKYLKFNFWLITALLFSGIAYAIFHNFYNIS